MVTAMAYCRCVSKTKEVTSLEGEVDLPSQLEMNSYFHIFI